MLMILPEPFLTISIIIRRGCSKIAGIVCLWIGVGVVKPRNDKDRRREGCVRLYSISRLLFYSWLFQNICFTFLLILPKASKQCLFDVYTALGEVSIIINGKLGRMPNFTLFTPPVMVRPFRNVSP